jgi:hypothetical protein
VRLLLGFEKVSLVVLAASTAACGPFGSEGAKDDLRRNADAGTPMDAGMTSGVDSVPPGASDEDSGGDCSVSALPSYSSLTENEKLPDPFQSLNGSRITTKGEWVCRRSEISAQAQTYELGPKPRKPVIVTGSFESGSIVVTAGDSEETVTFTATITLPSAGTAPYPAMIAMGGSSLNNADLDALGIASIRFPNDDVAQQMNASSRGRGKFYDLYGANDGAGAMMAWAWGVSLLIDALEVTPEAGIDAERLGVTGCSRNGKGALIAGAFDERIVLTIPQESGSGGSASWRVSDAMLAAGTEVQTLSQITGENCWFRSTFSQFGSSANRLPFDHHAILGMVAPRGLLVLENTSQVWLGNVSTYTASMVSHRVYEALGVPENMGLSQVANATHCQFPAVEAPIVIAFAKKFLLDDDSVDTDVLSTDGGYTLDEARWVDWETPALE